MIKSFIQPAPGVEPLKEHTETLFESAGLEGDDTIKFSQWVSTDHTELVFLETSRDKFTETFLLTISRNFVLIILLQKHKLRT